MMKIASIFIAFIVFGCAKQKAPLPVIIDTTSQPTDTLVTQLPVDSTDTTHLKTFLALGDSYTYGESVAADQKLPYLITAQLNELGIKTGEAEVIARTGWTTGNLLTRLNDNPPLLEKYDVVTLLIGVNNQYQGGSQEMYKNEFARLLDKAIAYAGDTANHVFVLSIPDWGVTPFATNRNIDLIAKQIDSFNIINKQISFARKVNYTDVTDISRMAATNPSLIAIDGLHPSGLQYKLWADRLVPTIRDTFK